MQKPASRGDMGREKAKREESLIVIVANWMNTNKNKTKSPCPIHKVSVGRCWKVIVVLFCWRWQQQQQQQQQEHFDCSWGTISEARTLAAAALSAFDRVHGYTAIEMILLTPN
eukprot:1148859-Pelagomonas_calceolata.AAC.12